MGNLTVNDPDGDIRYRLKYAAACSHEFQQDYLARVMTAGMNALAIHKCKNGQCQTSAVVEVNNERSYSIR